MPTDTQLAPTGLSAQEMAALDELYRELDEQQLFQLTEEDVDNLAAIEAARSLGDRSYEIKDELPNEN